MKFGKVIFFSVGLLIAFIPLKIYAQKSKLPKQIKILNNYDAIPFEDGKTIVADIVFTDSEIVPESDIFSSFRFRRVLVAVGSEFYGNEVARAVKIIRGIFAEKGYDRAEVTALGEKLSNDEMKIVFDIKRGAPARVSEIRFEGNVNFSSDELIADFKQCRDLDWVIYNAQKYNYMERKCTQQLMFGKGYFEARVKELKLRSVSGGYLVTIEINEGTRFRYGEIKIEGVKAFTDKEILEMFGQKTGDVADGRNLQNFVYERLKRAYADKGYILYNADFDPKFIEPAAGNPDGVVNLAITIDEGKLFKLAKLEFAGVEEEKAAELSKLVSLETGDLYNQTKIEEAIKKINDTKEFYPISFNSLAVEILTNDTYVYSEMIEGSNLLRRNDSDDDGGTFKLVFKLKKIEQ